MSGRRLWLSLLRTAEYSVVKNPFPLDDFFLSGEGMSKLKSSLFNCNGWFDVEVDVEVVCSAELLCVGDPTALVFVLVVLLWFLLLLNARNWSFLGLSTSKLPIIFKLSAKSKSDLFFSFSGESWNWAGERDRIQLSNFSTLMLDDWIFGFVVIVGFGKAIQGWFIASSGDIRCIGSRSNNLLIKSLHAGLKLAKWDLKWKWKLKIDANKIKNKNKNNLKQWF